MFPREESWRSAVFGAVIGAIITVMFLKFLENEGAAQRAEREIRRQDDLTDEPQKRPQEHDERNG